MSTEKIRTLLMMMTTFKAIWIKLKKMIPERNNLDNSRHLESPLEAAIVEPILEACASEASIMELTCVTQRLLPTPYNTLKKYLFYLIEYDLVAYRGRKRAYVITYNGLSLLFEIKREKMMVDSDSNDVLISFD